MQQSKLFTKTKKKAPKDAKSISHKYLAKGDFIEQSISGVYSYLPLGWKVFRNIETIIREEMKNLGAQEIYLPAMQNKKLWLETKRWNTIDPPLFKFKDRHDREIALGPTHEEGITDIVRHRIDSYKDLPFSLFQIQDKFRNEMRATGGLLRTREFSMKDLYSFHKDEKSIEKFYKKVKEAYFRIYEKCGVKAISVDAESGSIGGDFSDEFMVQAPSGEDKILLCKECGYGANIEKTGEIEKCPKCKGEIEEEKAIEVGHIFKLGTKYSKIMGATFKDKKGEEHPILMGCYGIGLSRLMATIVEVRHDKNGIIWPLEIAPFSIHLIELGNSVKVKKEAEKLYNKLREEGYSVLYDDRDKSAGEKFADSDLIGIPFRLVVSKKSLDKNSIGFKKRDKKEEKFIKKEEIENILKIN